MRDVVNERANIADAGGRRDTAALAATAAAAAVMCADGLLATAARTVPVLASPPAFESSSISLRGMEMEMEMEMEWRRETTRLLTVVVIEKSGDLGYGRLASSVVVQSTNHPSLHIISYLWSQTRWTSDNIMTTPTTV
jgi:hypothetical protein